MLGWGNQFNICCFLDNHNYHFLHTGVECVLAAGAVNAVSASAGNAFEALRLFSDTFSNDWLFGHFNYDLKSETEDVAFSVKEDRVLFPDLFFFIPETIIILGRNEISISSQTHTHQQVFDELCAANISNIAAQSITFSQRFSQAEYIATINNLKKHILRGDCYEINFCMEFFAQNISINASQTYLSLSSVSPNPFAAYYKLNDKYLLCASPERYLKKTGNKILSQPIKGTSQRNHTNRLQDEQYKQQLYESVKERAENVMVVDLVRNDLSKVCREGSVQVDELFGMYTFPQVHQMISTISGTIKSDLHWLDAIKATFPMGSMTGAPKKKVIELIDRYEKSKRGIFSGAVGYITPDNDFDFNVVIRSLMYNETNRYLSYQVGSGITYYCDPQMEYEECLLKAEGIKKLFC